MSAFLMVVLVVAGVVVVGARFRFWRNMGEILRDSWYPKPKRKDDPRDRPDASK
jgi:hypothetical protein